jgi:hypothetical protein
MKYLIYLLIPAIAFATTVKDRNFDEMKQVADAVRFYVLKHPEDRQLDSASLSRRITMPYAEGVYLQFDKRRLSDKGLLSPTGTPYLILVSESGVCVLMADERGDYNGAGAKHYFCSARLGVD